MLFVNKKTPVKKENNVTIKGGSIMIGSLLFNPVQSDIKRTTIENMSKNNNQSNKIITKSHIEFTLRKDNHFTVTLPAPTVNISTLTSSVISNPNPNPYIDIIQENTEPLSRSSKIETLSVAPPSLEPSEIKQWIEENIQKKIPKLLNPTDVISLMDKKISESNTHQLKKQDMVCFEDKIKQCELQISTLREQLENLEQYKKEQEYKEQLRQEQEQQEQQTVTIPPIHIQPEQNDITDRLNKHMEETHNIVETYIQDKLKELPTQQSIEELVEKYLHDVITKDETDSTDENDEKDENDESKTRFETLIEPAVARIVQRIIKYDYAQGKEFFRVPEETDLNLDIQYDEVYDYERQQEGSFELPVQEIKHPSQNLPGIYNPLYERKDLNREYVDGSQNVELLDVYKKEESVHYENELRSEFRSSRKWARIGSGIEKGSVLDMCLDKTNRKVYIVGHFKHVNRVPMDNIAMYNMNDKGWHNIGNGVPSVVTCISIYEESQIVFIGGVFTKVGKGDSQITAYNVAAYYVLQNRWVPLGEGLNRECSALYFDSTEEKLYAGGSFTQTGNTPLQYIGIYDLATNTWSKLYGGELSGPCRTLLKINNADLYMGGLFTHAGSSDIHVSYVAKYDLEKNTWSGLSGGLQGQCNALAYDDNEKALYVGGTFSSVGDRDKSVDAHHIAKYYIEHQKWDAMDGGVNNVVHSLCFDKINQCVYIGGNFTHTFENELLLNRIAIYTPYTRKWAALDNHFPQCKIPVDDEGNHNVGLNGVCKVLNMDKKSLFLAGSFQIAGNITANSIVRYILKR